MNGISLGSTVAASRRHLSSGGPGEKTLLQLEVGVCFRLDSVGARVWELIARPVKVSNVLESLLEEYDVPQAACKEDLFRLLEELARERLIDVSNADLP